MRRQRFASLCLIGLAWGTWTRAADAAPAETSVEPIAWLAGCWVGEHGTRQSRESWTRAASDFMIGVSTTVVDGKVREFEFLRITVKDGRIVYVAQPGGAPATTFTGTVGGTGREVVFANPKHDFPKRVGYRLGDEGALLAWIDGGEGDAAKRIEYPMKRVPCER